MSKIHSYLTFNGNCRQAMIFYQQCLGGELVFQTIEESPLAGKMPKKMKNLILHATLTNDNFVLMGSDMVPEIGLIRGNAVSLVLHSGNKKEIEDWYKKLSAGGQETHPLQKNFWGALFGALTDQFGNHWLLNYTKEQPNVKTEKHEQRSTDQNAH